MYVVRSGFDVWISVAVWRVQRPVSSPSSAIWPGEEQSRETSIVEACAEGLGRCTTGREKEWLWMRSGRKKQASRREVCKENQKIFLGVDLWILEGEVWWFGD
jgi:hypothetical protein